MQALPQHRKRVQLWCTHRNASCVRLLRLAGMEPLSWLLLRFLQMQAPPQHRTCVRPALVHAQTLQLRQAAQTGRDGAAKLVAFEGPADVSAASAAARPAMYVRFGGTYSSASTPNGHLASAKLQ